MIIITIIMMMITITTTTTIIIIIIIIIIITTTRTRMMMMMIIIIIIITPTTIIIIIIIIIITLQGDRPCFSLIHSRDSYRSVNVNLYLLRRQKGRCRIPNWLIVQRCNTIYSQDRQISMFSECRLFSSPPRT